jgi:putative SOS response-associated peptidase YedK
MCNLYRMTATVDEIRRVFGPFRGETRNLPAFGEIFPGYEAPVLRRDGDALSLDMMTWGFPGPTAAGGRPVTNVRNLGSPFWRSALNDPRRRCIVPVTQFCEWTAEPHPETKRKQKVWFALKEDSDPVFAFAGIWRPGETGRFMAFLTCEPNELVGPVHPKAMPVMLRPSDVSRWLGSPSADACQLAQPFAAAEMRILP